MAELEEKLNAILGNQEAMGQIMALARSLSGGNEGTHGPGDGGWSADDEGPSPVLQEAPPSMPDLSALLGQVDPSMLQMGMRLFQEYQGREDRNTALLAALRPFLREERRAKLDRAMEIARVTRLIRVALGAMGGKGAEGDV